MVSSFTTSAVRLLHEEAGLDNPNKAYPIISILKCIDRVKGAPPKRKLPITIPILWSFHDLLDLDKAVDLAFFAACVVCFFTFLRKSSLLSVKLKDHNPDLDLCRKDVLFVEEGVILSVRHTKTIQCKDRVLEIPLLRSSSPLCAVSLLEKLWDRFPSIDKDAPLFSYLLNDKLHCIEYDNFVSKVKSLVGRCGLNPGDYSGHSFRRGGCSHAYKNGVSPEYIMHQGDWKSDAWMKYLDIPLSSRWDVARVMVNSMLV